MSNDIIKKFQKAQLLLNNNAYAEIKGNSDYDYLINELIEYIEENENDQYIILSLIHIFHLLLQEYVMWYL